MKYRRCIFFDRPQTHMFVTQTQCSCGGWIIEQDHPFDPVPDVDVSTIRPSATRPTGHNTVAELHDAEL